MKKTPLLILFAKKPEPGNVKTRFIPRVTKEAAARIALEMLRKTVLNAVGHWDGEVCLYISPDTEHDAVREISHAFDIGLFTQAEGDLGRKMEFAIRDGLKSHSAAAVMGCDIPQVSARQLQFSCQRLKQGDNVLGPSADGGFYFLGLHEYKSGMLDNIQWGIRTVAQDTLARLAENGIKINVILECHQDIDTWENLEFLQDEWPELQNFMYNNTHLQR